MSLFGMAKQSFLVIALLLTMVATFVLGFPKICSAGNLSFVSDLIATSVPSATTTHTITFTVNSPVLPSGQISITPEGSGVSSFVVPFGFNASDIQFLVSSGGGPFVPRSLAAAQTLSDDGVVVVAGVNGSITITLASGVTGLLTNDQVKIILGSNNFIESPSIQDSYRIRIRSFDPSSSPLDIGTAMIAVLNQVDVSAQVNIVLPVRYNGLPSGLLPGATTRVLVSLNTDIPAFCKYATTSGVDFYSMSSSTIFLDANGGLLHYIEVAVAQNNIFSYYLRCSNVSG